MTKQCLLIGMMLVGLLVLPTTMFAQDDSCPTIVQDALATVDTACVDTGRNQVCYGNIILEAELQPGIQDFALDEPGDLADVDGVQTLRLSAMDTAAATWGIALMQLQANLPDTLPGQNVIFLLFGDVEIRNAVEPAPEPVLLDVTATNTINVRGGPSTNYAVVGSLANGQTVMADGHNEAGDWLRIQLEAGQIGWVYVPLMAVEGDMTMLPVLAADNVEPVVTEPEFGPMQSFYFHSGIGDAPCEAAPDSGLLIRTPDGVGQIEFLINEVRFVIGSTIFVQAEPGADMIVRVVEGTIELTSDEVTVTVVAEQQVRIPLDDAGRAVGAPSDPEPADPDVLGRLPVAALPVSETASDSGQESDVAAGVELPADGGRPTGHQLQLHDGCSGIFPAGEPVVLWTGGLFGSEFFDGPEGFLDEMSATLTFDGETVDAEWVFGPEYRQPQGALVVDYDGYWIVIPAAGAHQIVLEIPGRDPEFRTTTCTLIAEE